MYLLYSFLFCGTLCLIGQIILDNTKLTAGHITAIFVVVGAFLDIFDIYDQIIIRVGAGALVPITSFGHLLVHGGLIGASEDGLIGLSMGILKLTSSGICLAVVISFYLSFIFKPKD